VSGLVAKPPAVLTAGHPCHGMYPLVGVRRPIRCDVISLVKLIRWLRFAASSGRL
jgi:hypothetical protein